MSEREIKFLEALREKYADSPFGPLEAMQEFRPSELPESVRGYLAVHGPGIGATKALTRFLVAAGATRTSTRTNAGYLWMLP